MNMYGNSASSCSFNDIRQFNVGCIQQLWEKRGGYHGWNTFFNILDCVAMILMIWVFDGLRTINKDKDVGSLMVGCMEVATLINVITSLIETGIANTTKWMANNWKGLSEDKKHYADMEIAYMLCRGAFSWLFTIDDFIMVIPYFWAYMLARENDRIPNSYATESLLLALLSFLFFLMGMFELINITSRVFFMIIGLLYILIRFVWLFHSYSIFKKME